MATMQQLGNPRNKSPAFLPHISIRALWGAAYPTGLLCLQVLPARGPCPGQGACRDPLLRLEICSSVTRTVGTVPLSSHLQQLSCKAQAPSAGGIQDRCPRARAGKSARWGRQGSLWMAVPPQPLSEKRQLGGEPL